MEPKEPKKKKGPEAIIQDDLVKFLRQREWLVKETHGNVFQSGLPDLYCAHPRYGSRWIECKFAEAYSFTRAQRIFFPQLSSCGIGVWILVAATEDEYLKLWKPANWHLYLEVNKVVTRPKAVKHGPYVPKFPFKIPEEK